MNNKETITLVKEHRISADKSWGDLYYHVIPKVVNDNKCLIGVEIGVAFGGHAEAILSNTNIEKLYCVDAFQHYDGSTDSFFLLNKQPYRQPEYNALYELTKERLEKFGDRQILMREYSDAAYDIIDEKIDFVFIDAQHTYSAVLNDISKWYEKIKVGGILSGHDYNHPNFPGVTTAVDEFLSEKNLKLETEVGHVWWAKKTQ